MFYMKVEANYFPNSYLHACRYTYTAKLEVQHMRDTTWIRSPRPVVPWGLRKALNWVRVGGSVSLLV